MLVVIVLSLAVPVGYAFMPEVQKRRNAEAKNDELREKVEEQRRLLVRLQREELLLKNGDPEYIEFIARDLFGRMKEGEHIFQVVPAKPGASAAPRH